MIQNVLSSAAGIAIYGVVSVCLFFLVFGAALLWSLALKQSFLQSMETLPLCDGEITTPLKGDVRHE